MGDELSPKRFQLGQEGYHARLTPVEGERAVEDPRWAMNLIEELINVGTDEPGGSQPRCLDIGKAWDALALMLRRIDFPVDIVHGEEEIPGADDWGVTCSAGA